MTITKHQVEINAPVSVVFDTISNVENFSEAVPGIVKIELLSEQKIGLGTRFKETREMNGRQSSTVLEVIEYTEDKYIRLVSDEGKTIWDTIFKVEPSGKERTLLSLEMTAKPYSIFAKIMSRLIYRVVKKAIISDMESIKDYCELKANNNLSQ